MFKLVPKVQPWMYSKTVGAILVVWATTRCTNRTSTIQITTVVSEEQMGLLVTIMDLAWWLHSLLNHSLPQGLASSIRIWLLEVRLHWQIQMILTSSTSSSSNGKTSHRCKVLEQRSTKVMEIMDLPHKLLKVQNCLANSRHNNRHYLPQMQRLLNYCLNNKGQNR